MKNISKTNKLPNPEIFQPTPSRKSTILSSFKYLRRTRCLTPDNQKTLIKLNTKRIHIRKLIQKVASDNFFVSKPNGKTSQKRLKTNLFKGLTDLQFSSLYGLYWIEDLKNFKSLRKFACQPCKHCQLGLLLKYLKRTNKNIEAISLITGNYYYTTDSLKKHYKAIRKFSKLKVFHTKARHGESHELIKQEFQYQNRYLSRITSLQGINCYLPWSRRVPLRNIIQKGAVYAKITQLDMPLYYFRNSDELKQNFLQNERGLENIAENSDGYSVIKRFEQSSQEIAPYFPFQVFPNLKQLGLQIMDMGLVYHPIPFSLVTKGFPKLCSLEKFHLHFQFGAPQADEIFKGILDLPQLSSFSLVIASSTSSHWEMLTKFLKKQANIISLKFEISEQEVQGPKKEGKSIEDFLANLSQKPKLQYLSLKSHSWPLSNLFRGLKRVVNTNQIKSFALQVKRGRFDIATSFQGLCEFLLRNKGTLYELVLDFPLLDEQKSHEEISKAISQLSQLKNLSLKFSVLDMRGSPISEAINEIFQDRKEQRNPRLDILLRPLKKLENLTLDFSEIDRLSLPNQKWRSSSFKILPQLESLRRFEFMIPDELSKAEAKTINSALENLKHLNDLNFQYVPGCGDGLKMGADYYIDWREHHHFGRVMEKVKTIRAQQDLRLNLSF